MNQVRLEYNTRVVQLDGDANGVILMTHRGGNGMFLSIMELANSNFANPIWNVEFEERFGPGLAIVVTGQIPTTYSLKQNYPNPFNPVTRISFDIPEVTNITLRIYDLLGRNVMTLVDEQMEPGYYVTVWDGKNNMGARVASGVYIYHLVTQKFISMKKMVLLR